MLLTKINRTDLPRRRLVVQLHARGAHAGAYKGHSGSTHSPGLVFQRAADIGTRWIVVPETPCGHVRMNTTMCDPSQHQSGRLIDAINRLAAAVETLDGRDNQLLDRPNSSCTRLHDDPMCLISAEMEKFFAAHAEKINLILAEVRPLGQNAIIERIRARGWANLSEASVYLGRSDTFLRRYLDQPGDGDPDPAKLNGQKGQKDWTFTVAELDRFSKDFLRTSVPTVDSDGVEIRKSQVTSRRPR